MGISYYFMNKANKQVGPLSLDELKQKGITRETPCGVKAKDIPEPTRVYRNSQPLHQRGAAHTDFICHLGLHRILIRG